mmetsp:Transcript_22879/g.23105  ORF Transcript_22879/g.23105 Transcript_22879/m.23105 type:complete len:274 (-) Transcript_22879:91-912(-)
MPACAYKALVVFFYAQCALSFYSLNRRQNCVSSVFSNDNIALFSKKKIPYRLWDDNGVLELGMLAKPVGAILNLAGDLLRVQGSDSIYPPEDIRNLLFQACEKGGLNGLKASKELREEIHELVHILEQSNPTNNPAKNTLMDGYWRLLYTSTTTGGNAGRLGPLTGVVYQDLSVREGIIRNICAVGEGTIRGVLEAKWSVYDSNTWRIDFTDLIIRVFGMKLFTKPFPSGTYRLWEITYLDNDLRILRARSPENTKEKAFIFILIRDEKERTY